MPQELTAAGSAAAQALFSPVLTSKPSYVLTASGAAVARGAATALNRVLPAGGLTDFGVWAATQPDTAMTRDYSRAVGTDATTSRAWLAASAPNEYRPGGEKKLWNRAAYAALGIKWASVPSAQAEAFQQVQFEEVAPTGNRLSWEATSWETRRCYNAQANAQYAVVETTSDTAFSGSKCGKITYTGAPAGQFGYWINPVVPTGMAPCTPGEKLNGSVSLRMDRAAIWAAGLQFYDANFALIGTWNFGTTGYSQHPGGGRWATSTAYNCVVPASAVWAAVVPHISINSAVGVFDAIAPVGEVAYCDMHRIWSVPYNIGGVPAAYTPPRKLTVDIKANRTNLVRNPSFDSGTDLRGWGSHGIPSYNPLSLDPGQGRIRPGAMKYTAPANVGTVPNVASNIGLGMITSYSTSQVGGFGQKIDSYYMVSIYVKLASGCPPVTLITGNPVITGVLSTEDALSNHPELVEGSWIRLWAQVSTSDDDDGLVYIGLDIETAAVTAGGQAATFWADDALAEEGDQLLPYFDGNSPGSDYLWSGTPGYSASHYYREFRANAYRLKDIVQAQVPHGTQIEIRYARPPQ